MGYDMEMEEYHDDKREIEELKKELEKLLNEITEEAKLVVEDYTKNISQDSGSVTHIHINSPLLDEGNDVN